MFSDSTDRFRPQLERCPKHRSEGCDARKQYQNVEQRIHVSLRRVSRHAWSINKKVVEGLRSEFAMHRLKPATLDPLRLNILTCKLIAIGLRSATGNPASTVGSWASDFLSRVR